jgi:hypothetical protein
VATLRLQKKFQAVNGVVTEEVAISADEKLAALGLDAGHGRDLAVWEVGDDTKLLRQIPGHDRASYSLAFAATGTHLAALSDDAKGEHIDIMDAANGKPVRSIDLRSRDVGRLCYSPDGRYLAGAGTQFVRLWNANTGQPLRQIQPAKREPEPLETVVSPSALSFSPDGKLVAVGMPGGVQISEASSGLEVARLRGHDGTVHTIAFLPDGLRLVTGGHDTTAILWDLRRVLAQPPPDGAQFPRLLLDQFWRDLDAEDARTAYGSVAGLIDRPVDAVKLLAERLTDRESRTPRRLDRALVVLESIGGADAKKLLKDLAASKDLPQDKERHPAAEAALALRRLEGRPVAAPEPFALSATTRPAAGEFVASGPFTPTSAPATQAVAPQALVQPATHPGALAEPVAAVPAGPPPFKAARVPRPATAPPAIPAAPVLDDPQAVRNLVRSGDRRVLATLDQWLNSESDKREIGRGSLHLHVALEGLAAFPAEAEIPALVALFNNPTADATVRQDAAAAVAATGSKAARDFLIDAFNDPALGEPVRLQVAVALVELDVDAARDELIDVYQEYLDSLSGNIFSKIEARTAMATLGDAKLMDRVAALSEKQHSDRARNNIRNLLETMKLNAAPLDDLRKLAEDDKWENARKRYDAIKALGRRGGPETFKTLKSLKPWPPGSGGDNSIQQNFIQEFRDKAIAEIKRRHWPDLPPAG